ncbi:MAG TPA: lipid II flippase MurJ [Bryobacteraceae bacterium]|nr:lipid II flippase MurJ [Bryobacteraceae bacterium]
MEGLTARADTEVDQVLVPAHVALASEPKPRRSDWNIVTQTLGVGAITVIAKTAGASKAVFLARFFGSSKELDAYLISFLIPSLLCDALSGALVPALVPSLIEAEHLDGRNSANAIYSYSLRRALLLMVLLAGAVAGCLGILSALARPVGLSGLQLERELLLIMVPMLPLSAVNGVWRSLLNARKRFFVAAMAPALTPLVIIGVLFCWSGSFGVYALAFGTTAGMAAEMLVLGAAVHYLGYRVAPPAMATPSAAPSIHAQYRALLVSNFLVGGSAFINQAIAATLSSGSISIFNFGTRLITVLLAIGPVSLSTIILPSFSEISAERDWGSLRRSVIKYVLGSLAVVIPVTVGLISFSEPVAHLLFHRGAFGEADTKAVAVVQACSLLQLPVATALVIVTRLVASLKANQILLPCSVFGIVANAVLDYVLVRRYGVAGIALGTAVAWTLMLALLSYLLFRWVRASGLSRSQVSQ